ncbi:MAG: type II secretory pathway, component PulD, partial [Isosphaeraceae bacterium]|nr:type II secretory pathway, component PulD [Isosphaeraceae bacterium]
PDQTAATPSPGQQLLEQARALMNQGNFAAAKQEAQKIRASGLGLESQADELLGQIVLAEQASALKLYEAALDALRKGDQDRARALLTEMSTAELDPATAQKVQDLLARLRPNGSGKASVGEPTPDDTEAVANQKLNLEIGTKIAEARRLMEVDPDQAIQLLQAQLDAVKAAPVSPAVAKTMTRRVEVAIELAKKDKAVFDKKMQDKAYRDEIERKKLRILEADKAKKAQFAELMQKAQQAMSENRFEDAELLARKANAIDPNEVAAVALMNVANVRRHYERDKELRTLKNEGALTAFQEVDRASVADPEVMKRDIAYPTSFAELTQKRRALNERLKPRKDPAIVAIEAKLNDPVSLNFADTPLGEALEFLRSYTGLNIVPDQGALAEEGLTLGSKVTLQVKDIKLKNALKLMLQPLHLTYRVDEEVLLITSPQSNRQKLITQAYDVTDLVIPREQGQQGPRFDGTFPSPNPLSPEAPVNP